VAENLLRKSLKGDESAIQDALAYYKSSTTGYRDALKTFKEEAGINAGKIASENAVMKAQNAFDALLRIFQRNYLQL